MNNENEPDDSADVQRFAAIEARQRAIDEVRSTMGHFLGDFGVFESLYLTAALKALSFDPVVIDHLPELMDLRNRLTLLKRLAVARQLPQPLVTDIDSVRAAARQLAEWRNEIAHGAAVLLGTSLTKPDSGGMFGGVQRPHSKRAMPKAATDPKELIRKWSHSAETIRALIPVAQDLTHAAMQLAYKLGCHQRGEPWDNIVVPRVTVPKLPEPER